MSTWKSLESVPKDGSEVLFWVPFDQSEAFDEGEVVVGKYDAACGDYYAQDLGDIEPIAWMPRPRGPQSLEDIDFDEDER